MTHFWDLVNIEEFWMRRTDFSEERGEISFYCKDCQQLVQVDRPNPHGYIFMCQICQGKNVAIGTQAGLLDMYKRK